MTTTPDDPLELLIALIRNDPTAWPDTDTMSDERMAELTDQAIESGRRRSTTGRRHRRTAPPPAPATSTPS